MSVVKQTDYLIIGAGIIGLTTAYYLQHKYPHKSILILDKENDIAQHASGRNSGVLHAGLYYASDSLRAKFCVSGAQKIREYSLLNDITLNQCGKVIVAANESEIAPLKTLFQQALANGVNARLVDEQELAVIEPTAKTTQWAIYSPDTASFDAKSICSQLKTDLSKLGVKFSFNCKFEKSVNDHCIRTNQSLIEYETLINCAGMYADKIAQHYGLIENYTLIPFKGIFLYCEDLIGNYTKHIYPLPDQKIKLLGSHFSPEFNGRIKIGPTAVPCLSRENYRWLSNLRYSEMQEILKVEFKLLMSNQFNFRDLAFAELKKQSKAGLIKNSQHLVKDIQQFRFTNWGVTGIQPRLYDIKNQTIMDDFLISKVHNSLHVVNSVSPAFSASFAFSEHLVASYL